MRDRSKQLLVINTGKKESEQTRLPAQSGTTHIIGGGGLSANMSDYLLKSIWDKVWEIRTDSQGIEYIFGKLPVVTQYGITMYSGEGVNVPSLASGLPFDGRTIWYNPDTQQIEVIGGTGGGSGEGVSNFWDLSGIPSWITNSKPKYAYSEIEGTPDLSGYATESWVLGKSYITSAALGTELGKYVTLDTDQSLKGKKDFKNGLSIDGLEIRKSQDDVVYIDANLVVRGGVTMYAQNEVDIPSIIDSIPTASTTVKGIASFDGAYFSVVNGKVSLIASNVGLNEEELYNYLTSNNYAKKSDIPSLVGYATQSWVENKKYLTAITSAMVTSALGFTPFNAASFTKSNIKSTLGISDWALAASKPSYTTSEVSEGTNLYFTNARAVSALTETLKAYVTLSGSQTITGEKNFTGGLKVNDSLIYYDKEKKYWKLEGDLLVTGGVTMYGSDSSFTPSTIMDALLYDDTTLGINSNGELYVKGGTSGGGLDITALQNYLTQNSYLNVTSGDNRYLKLSGGAINGTSNCPFTVNTSSKVIELRLKSNSNIKAYIGWNTTDGVFLQEGESTAYIGIQTNKNPYYFNGTRYTLWHEGNFTPSDYLPLSGGTITSASPVSVTLNANNDGQTSLFLQSKGTNKTYVGWDINRGTCLYDFSSDSHFGILNGIPRFNSNTIWHSGNDGSGSGLDADLLDGYHAIDFTKTINSNVDDFLNFTNRARFQSAYLSGQGDFCSLVVPTWGGNNSSNWYLSEIRFGIDETIKFRTSHNGSVTTNWKTFAFTDSNVASATYSPNTSKLYSTDITYSYGSTNPYYGYLTFNNTYGEWDFKVSPSTPEYIHVYSSDKLRTARTIWGQSFDGTGDVSGNMSGVSVINSFIKPTLGTSSVAYLHITNFKSTQYDGVHIYVANQDNSNTSRTLVLQNGYGNVGIGVDIPSQKLHVDGNLKCNIIYGTNLYANTGGEGLYISGSGIYYHNSSNSWMSDLMYFTSTGNVGIGTASPSAKLHVVGNFKTNDVWIGSDTGTYIEGTQTGGLRIQYANSENKYTQIQLKDLTVTINNNLLCSGGITMYSDQRKKTILNHVELSLKQIADAPLIEHYYNSDESKTTHVGSIAQYWANMNDWFCKLDNEGYYTMEIQNAALASAISIARELDRYETKTDKAIKKLKKRICELEEEVERLKSA